MPQPAHGLGDGGETRALGVGTGLAVAGDARDDEARVDLPQLLGPDAPALQCAWAEVLHERVGALDQL